MQDVGLLCQIDSKRQDKGGCTWVEYAGYHAHRRKVQRAEPFRILAGCFSISRKRPLLVGSIGGFCRFVTRV